MKWSFVIAALAVGIALQGCAKSETPATQASSGSGTAAGTSSLDQGPRASESAMNEDLAKQGEQLFKDKGCSACHAFGKRVTGPDLAGVSERRTAKWIGSQILHPDKMTKEDPIARRLFAEFALQMPNQGLTEAEAAAVVEFFKYRDHEAAESH